MDEQFPTKEYTCPTADGHWESVLGTTIVPGGVRLFQRLGTTSPMHEGGMPT